MAVKQHFDEIDIVKGIAMGYLFAHSKPRTFVENFKKKASRLLIPYLCYELVNLGVKLAMPSLVNRKIGGSRLCIPFSVCWR